MSKRWLRERQSDPFYRKAKAEGYRSRAAYKLQEINGRFRVFRRGDKVVDLGAAPGGWTQVVVEVAGRGNVVAVDVAGMAPVEGATVLRGDMTEAATAEAVRAALGGEAHCVLSDMSPDISGAYDVDHARSIFLCETALRFARATLAPGGSVVIKVFQGEDYPAFLNEVRRLFGFARAFDAEASRKRSAEVYVLGKGFNGDRG